MHMSDSKRSGPWLAGGQLGSGVLWCSTCRRLLLRQDAHAFNGPTHSTRTTWGTGRPLLSMEEQFLHFLQIHQDLCRFFLVSADDRQTLTVNLGVDGHQTKQSLHVDTGFAIAFGEFVWVAFPQTTSALERHPNSNTAVWTCKCLDTPRIRRKSCAGDATNMGVDALSSRKQLSKIKF